MSRALVLLLLAWPSLTFAQDQRLPPRDRLPAPTVGTAAIKGRVVSAATGAAVPRARVWLQGPMSGRPSVLTDADGAFAFTQLPAASYSLSVEKTGYLPGRYPEAGRSLRTLFRPIVVRDGQVLDGVTISLSAASAITGRVVDAHGDAVEHAEVLVLRVPRSGRGGRPGMRTMAATNDLGEFRVARLQPGNYLLRASPRRGGPPEDTAGLQPVATYYPGVGTIDQAQPITIERGESVTGVELVLLEGTETVITGTVVSANGQPVPMASVSVRGAVADVDGGFQGTIAGTGTRPDGTFRFSLSPGDYVFEGHAMRSGVEGSARVGDEQYGLARVAVAGEMVSGIVITLGTAARVSGRLVFDGTSPPPTNVQELRAQFFTPDEEGPTCRSGRSEIKPDWTFTIEGLIGTCVARGFGWTGRWSIKTILHNGEDLLDRPVAFDVGQQLRDVQVVLTDRRTEVALKVTDERGQPTREYVALVFPVDKARRRHQVRTHVHVPRSAQATAAASATMTYGLGPGLPPLSLSQHSESIVGLRAGEYYAIAVDDLDAEDVSDPVVLDRLASRATRVVINDGAVVEVALRRVRMQ